MSDLPTELVPLSPEQRDIVQLSRAFAEGEIRPRARAVDEADTVTPWDLWRKAAGVGITGFMLPEEYGGAGFTDVFTQCLVQEELCAGDLGIATCCAPTASSPTPCWSWAASGRSRSG